MDNKKLNDRIAARLGLKKANVQNLQDGLIETLRNQLTQQNTIAVPGFGTFEAKKKNERVVTNPSNGKRLILPPKITLNFQVSNVLKSKLK